MNTSHPRSKVPSLLLHGTEHYLPSGPCSTKGLKARAWSEGREGVLLFHMTSPIILQVGLVDLEINRLTKILFVATVMLSLLLLIVKVEEGVMKPLGLFYRTGFSPPSYRDSLALGSFTSFDTSYSSPTSYQSGGQHAYTHHTHSHLHTLTLTPSYPHTFTQPSCEPGHGEGGVLMDDSER